MALTDKQVQSVCCFGGGPRQCRYLDDDVDGTKIFLCRKLSPDKKIIDEETEDWLAEQKKNGVDPYTKNEPLGDNCPGYVVLRTKPQGFDVK